MSGNYIAERIFLFHISLNSSSPKIVPILVIWLKLSKLNCPRMVPTPCKCVIIFMVIAQSSTVQLPHHAAKHAEIRSLKVTFYTSIMICMDLVVKNYIQGKVM